MSSVLSLAAFLDSELCEDRYLKILFHREFPCDQPDAAKVVILHGLFGNSKNWQTIGQQLANEYHVFALDLRNHGESFHDDDHSFTALAGDLKNWFEHTKCKKAHIIGHSMGGMAAMALALSNGQYIDKLIVVDIAPRSYSRDYSNEFAALSINLDEVSSRPDIDRAMAKHVEDVNLRQFLQTNIYQKEGKYFVRVNVEGLRQAQLEHRLDFEIEGVFDKPALFIRGELSNLVVSSDEQVIEAKFPQATIATISGAAHWLHHTHLTDFLTLTRDFLIP